MRATLYLFYVSAMRGGRLHTANHVLKCLLLCWMMGFAAASALMRMATREAPMGRKTGLCRPGRRMASRQVIIAELHQNLFSSHA